MIRSVGRSVGWSDDESVNEAAGRMCVYRGRNFVTFRVKRAGNRREDSVEKTEVPKKTVWHKVWRGDSLGEYVCG